MHRVQEPRQELDAVALLGDLEVLLAAQHHRLEHLVRADVRLRSDKIRFYWILHSVYILLR